MSWSHTFGSLSGTIPLSYLDDNFGDAVLLSSVKVKQQVFTASGTYTPTSGMLYAIVKAVGGGGGGGGSSASFYGGGGGGGGGETAEKVLSASDIGSSQTVTIGAGGTVTIADAGGSGGNTSLGTLVVAKGGGGGSNGNTSAAAALGGTVVGTGTGDVLIPGETGGIGIGALSNVCQGGNGGNSTMGFGAPLTVAATTITSGSGSSGVGYGSGGSGAVQVNSGSTFAGGVGKAGILIVTEFIAASS